MLPSSQLYLPNNPHGTFPVVPEPAEFEVSVLHMDK